MVSPQPNLNPASMAWARSVTAKGTTTSATLRNAGLALQSADRSIQSSITRTGKAAVELKVISDYLTTLAIVGNATRSDFEFV